MSYIKLSYTEGTSNVYRHEKDYEHYSAQTILIGSSDIVVNKFSFKFYTQGFGPSDLSAFSTCGIRRTNNGAMIDGLYPDIVTAYPSVSLLRTITTDSNGEWCDFTFANTTLYANTSYALLFITTIISTSEYLYCKGGGGYTGGDGYYNRGTPYSYAWASIGADYDFKLWGQTDVEILSTSIKIAPKLVGYKNGIRIGFQEKLLTAVGLISNVVKQRRGFQLLSTLLGLAVTSFTRKSFSIRGIITKVGLISNISRSFFLSRFFNISVGLVSNLRKGLDRYFSTVLALVSNVGYLQTYAFIVYIGLLPTVRGIKEWKRIINTVVGLVSSISKDNARQLLTQLGIKVILTPAVIGRVFSIALGLLSTINKTLSLKRGFNNVLSLTPNLSRLSSAVLTTVLGLLSDTPFFRKGKAVEFITSIGLKVLFDKKIGKVLNTVIGLVANHVWLKRSSYYEVLKVTIGLISRTPIIGLSKSFIATLGVVATLRFNIGRVLILTTVLGLVSFLHMPRRNIEVLATKLGISVIKLSSNLFGRRKAKTLKFHDNKTDTLNPTIMNPQDKKKLQIKK